jgi:hypothetical protein
MVATRQICPKTHDGHRYRDSHMHTDKFRDTFMEI